MNKLYLLNESTHHQIECNTICQRLYYHLASLQRESGAIKATVKHIADGVGISESGARYWMLLMQDAAVITMQSPLIVLGNKIKTTITQLRDQ